MKRHKGILLYSGGLDSILAARLLQDQGIEITGFHCILPFVASDADPEDLEAVKLARQVNLPLIFHRCGQEYLEMVKNPPHGYGSNINPCIDCKIYIQKKAAEYKRETGADFIASGEVVGQRPMSQLKHTLIHIAKITGLEDILVRPLSAKLLKPTDAEKKGIVDREKLLDISGRGRSRQMELARHYGIGKFSSPSGGCLFTDPNIARRVADVFAHHADFSQPDIHLLTTGRHYRLDDHSKLIVGRNEAENLELEKYSASATALFIPDFRGPSALLRGEPDSDLSGLIASLILRHGKPDHGENSITMVRKGNPPKKILAGEPAGDEILERLRI